MDDMTAVYPSWDTPIIGCGVATAFDPMSDVIPTDSLLQIEGRPDVQVNEPGLSLVRAVAKAMFIHTGKAIYPGRQLADRIELLDISDNVIKLRIREG